MSLPEYCECECTALHYKGENSIDTYVDKLLNERAELLAENERLKQENNRFQSALEQSAHIYSRDGERYIEYVDVRDKYLIYNLYGEARGGYDSLIEAIEGLESK